MSTPYHNSLASNRYRLGKWNRHSFEFHSLDDFWGWVLFLFIFVFLYFFSFCISFHFIQSLVLNGPIYVFSVSVQSIRTKISFDFIVYKMLRTNLWCLMFSFDDCVGEGAHKKKKLYAVLLRHRKSLEWQEIY